MIAMTLLRIMTRIVILIWTLGQEIQHLQMIVSTGVLKCLVIHPSTIREHAHIT